MKLLNTVLFLACPLIAFCQPRMMQLNGFSGWLTERDIHQKGSNFHTSVKPYHYQEIKKYLPVDTINFLNKNSRPDSLKKNSIFVSPLAFLTGSYDMNNSKFYSEKAIGLNTEVVLGSNFAFGADYIYSNSTYNCFLDSIIKERHVIPGANYAYRSGSGWRYSDVNFYLSAKISKYFNLQAGKARNFFGEGYRSLLLSDNGASYPFLKFVTTAWKNKYVNLYMLCNDVSQSDGFVSRFKNKFSAMHYLSMNLTKSINISFFEAIVWQASDSSSNRGFDVNYINPVIFYRPVEFSIGSPDNAFIGLNLSCLFAKNQQFYAQMMMDEFNLSHIRSQDGWWGNKQAYQAGFKSFDLFRLPNLTFQTEYNYIRPYTYAHLSPSQNYGHYNQPLAHPAGANLTESASFLRYRYNHLLFEARFIYSEIGMDTARVNYGGNIYKSYLTRFQEYDNYTGQGVKNTMMFKELRIYYLFLYRLNWNVYLSVSDISEKNILKNRNIPFISLGLSSFLKNPYLGLY